MIVQWLKHNMLNGEHGFRKQTIMLSCGCLYSLHCATITLEVILHYITLEVIRQATWGYMYVQRAELPETCTSLTLQYARLPTVMMYSEPT